MWQPNRAQWRVIWVVAILLILAWPSADGHSLAVKSVRWLADPQNELPVMPDPLPMGLGDDGDAVAEHDRQMQEYYEFYEGSSMNRLRLRLKGMEEPLAPGTERQLLVGLAVLAALGVWKLDGPADRR
jgi:hypothetical protein